MRRAATVLLLLLVGCSDNSLVVTLEASPWTATQIPRRGDDPAGLDDGFTVVIEKLLLVVSNVELEDEGEVVLSSLSARVFNAKKIGAHELARVDGLAPKRYGGVSFDVAPASIARSGNADSRDVELMTSSGWSVYVEGVATKKFIHAFRWGFDTSLAFSGCGEGQSVPERGVGAVPLVVHGEALFSAGFAPFRAADVDDDRYTTLVELERAGMNGAVTDSLRRLVDCPL